MSTISQIAEPKQQLKFSRLLVGTDFSSFSAQAFAYGAFLQKKFDADLTIAHALAREPRESVIFDPLPRELDARRLQAEQQMETLIQRLPAPNLHTVVARGDVWEVLSTAVERDHTDLIILGTSGRHGLGKLALGSVAEEVLHQAQRPVLTVGPNVPARGPQYIEFQTIVFATDFGPASAKAFPYALMLAEECHAKLVLLHMVPHLPEFDGPVAYCPGEYAASQIAKWQAETCEQSTRALRLLVPAGAELACEPEYVVGVDFVADGILEAAELRCADLIVMGVNRSRSAGIAAHIPWTLTHDVIRDAKCPVLTVLG